MEQNSLMLSLPICLLILKCGLALQCVIVAVRGLSTVKYVELFKPWFTLLRGNHINPFHNGACDSDACFHSKRGSFYHFRIMINKSTDCFGRTYWCLYSLSLLYTPRFFSPKISYYPNKDFFFFFPLLSFIPANLQWLLSNKSLGCSLLISSSTLVETRAPTFTASLRAFFNLLPEVFAPAWTPAPSLLLVSDFRATSNVDCPSQLQGRFVSAVIPWQWC